MGTSSPFGGAGPASPLIPPWLDDDTAPDPPHEEPEQEAPETPQGPPDPPPPTPEPEPDRYRVARSNFSRFASSGGRDRQALGRALGGYVRTAAGGSRTAAARMAPSTRAAGRLASFFSSTRTEGAIAALRRFDLDALAGRPVVEVLAALTDFICPEGGNLDDSIARDAFIETLVELADGEPIEFEALTTDQMVVVLESFVSRSIVDRIVNDIGLRAIELPADILAVERIQQQLTDFVRGAVGDALTRTGASGALDGGDIDRLMQQVYVTAFDLLEVMADGAAQ